MNWPSRPPNSSVWLSIKHTVLTFAVIHLAITLVGTIFSRDWQDLNLFNIIGIGEKSVRLGTGERAFLSSYVLAGIIAIIYLVLIEKEKL